MKTKIIVSVVAILILLCAWATYSHIPHKAYSSKTVVLKDLTDRLKAKPDAASIIRLLNLQEHPWEYANVRFATLTNFDYTYTHEISLKSKFILLSNPDERTREIDTFNLSISAYVDSINSVDTVLPRSSVWLPLVRELNELSESKAQSRNLIAYTDACENTPNFSIYDSTDRNLLIKDRAAVKRKLEKVAKPKNLRGINVYLVYQPSDENANLYFSMMSDLLAEVLRDAGAKVIIGANLITENNY